MDRSAGLGGFASRIERRRPRPAESCHIYRALPVPLYFSSRSGERAVRVHVCTIRTACAAAVSRVALFQLVVFRRRGRAESFSCDGCAVRSQVRRVAPAPWAAD